MGTEGEPAAAAAGKETASAREERLRALTGAAAKGAQGGGGGAEQLPAAESLKGEGNQLFKVGEHSTAAQTYQLAISLFSPEAVLDPDVKSLVVILHSNAAEALLRLGAWKDAQGHAENALKLDAEHNKSLGRAKRAAMAVDMEASGDAAVLNGTATKEEMKRAVSAMVTLRREDAPMSERALCTQVNGRQDDRVFEVMTLLTPSVYQVLAEIVSEELRELPERLTARTAQRGCLTSALLTTNLRATEGRYGQSNPYGGQVAMADKDKCLAFLQTGVWPSLIRLQQLLFDELQDSDRQLELIAKPLYRFIPQMLSFNEVNVYILEHHCTSPAEVRPLRNLMSLGDDTADSPMCSEVANQMEGLTNTTVALLACTAEETGTCTQFEGWALEGMNEQEKMMYMMMAKPNAQAMIARGRTVSTAEFSNAVKANAYQKQAAS